MKVGKLFHRDRKHTIFATLCWRFLRKVWFVMCYSAFKTSNHCILIHICCRKYLKKEPTLFSSTHQRAGMPDLFSSHGDSLTQSSEIFPPSLLSSYWWVTTTSTLCLKFPKAFVVYLRQTHALPQYLSLLSHPVKEGKRNTNLVQKKGSLIDECCN